MSPSTTTYSKRNGKLFPVRNGNLLRSISSNFCKEYDRIEQRIEEGKVKRQKQAALWKLLTSKIQSVQYPMQELELIYPTTKGKIYSEEEDRYLLVRLHHYGMKADDVYERIKKDITEFPVFRFDWFFKSRTTQELQRRCNTLLGLIEKEAEDADLNRGPRNKKRAMPEAVMTVSAKASKGSRSSTPLPKASKKTRS